MVLYAVLFEGLEGSLNIWDASFRSLSSKGATSWGSTLGPLIFSISHIAVFVAFEKSSVLESRASVVFRAV